MAQKKTPQGRGRPAGTGTDAGGGNRMFYLVVGAIVVAGIVWLLVARGGGAGSVADLPTPEEFQSLATEVEADASVGIPHGPESAPVEILEFVDYSCPACGRFAGFAGKLLRQNYVETADAPVRWVLYDYVLGSFPNSVPAAIAARCAGDQGRYWPMHDLLFSQQTSWYTSSSPGDVFADIASQVGLDMGAWRECVSEGRHLEEIAASRKYGEQMGVSSTPTLFLNGRRLDLQGRDPYSYIEGLIRAELEAGSTAEGEATATEDGGP